VVAVVDQLDASLAVMSKLLPKFFAGAPVAYYRALEGEGETDVK